MILDIDIGNSRLKWVLRDAEGAKVARGQIAHDQSTAPLMDVDQRVSRVRVASVKGDLDRDIDDLCRRAWGLIPEYARVVPGKAGLACGYREPRQLGVDRWLAVLACWQNISRQAVVADAGSALTIDILADGAHRGGYILPGLALMERALGAGTWGVTVESGRTRDDRPGVETASAVSNGSLIASAGAVEHAATVAGIRDIVLTGGDSCWLRRFLSPRYRVTEVPDLVIDGLAVAMA